MAKLICVTLLLLLLINQSDADSNPSPSQGKDDAAAEPQLKPDLTDAQRKPEVVRVAAQKKSVPSRPADDEEEVKPEARRAVPPNDRPAAAPVPTHRHVKPPTKQKQGKVSYQTFQQISLSPLSQSMVDNVVFPSVKGL